MRFGRIAMIVLAVLLAGALIPVAAQAQPSFKAGFYPATLHGSAAKGVQKITTEGGTLECATAYHAELKAASTTLSLAPTYSECGFSPLTAAIHPNGCRYLLHVSKQIAEDEYTATFDVSCEAGKAILLTVAPTPICEVEIPTQSGLGTVKIANDTEASPKKDLTFKPEVTGLTYNVIKDGFGCPFSGTGTKTGGTYTASSATTLTGQSPSNPETKLGVEVG
jgi:hypothetical protein